MKDAFAYWAIRERGLDGLAARCAARWRLRAAPGAAEGVKDAFAYWAYVSEA
ncbi:MAG: hypothetical protein LBG81_05980 [Coriobacteriaceae bacterium]|nr:hypothetical protein [Coriobacteriaceae bacterium]